eukprot:CAMPEP_0181101252 /NCGR_PEP_ID=MMETSP1071-20121207/13649_1 /TAXON_ID=35127 /ORGANISM="Thalassiosira sp., Strain NH16" /LENGTH=213 /DNA_ID=CAMNT_0023184079 /DNA_START=63 /DNA_END=704 /DNA_ORIENTATION=+
MGSPPTPSTIMNTNTTSTGMSNMNMNMGPTPSSVMNPTSSMGDMNMGSPTGTVPMTMPAGSPMPHMGSMHGYFFGDPGFYYLFEGWFVSTTSQLIGACFATLALAVVLTVISGSFLKPLAKGSRSNDGDGSATVVKDLVSGVACVIESLFHYVLMLIAMTYNGWILVALVVGIGMGHVVNLVVSRKRKPLTSGVEEKEKDKSGGDDGVETGCH